ncbi:Gfo/Idh/MocA family oxidoreductase [Pirellulaceae bacterium]|jgi:predicted dehydrogenase|nr:Gfo/Idh/MocA family oxidoreductase [Pirellulaceae bacterium]
MSAAQCRWGILSTAEIAQKNWASICHAPNALLAAVGSRSVDKANAFIDMCSSSVPCESRPTAFGSYEELIASDDIDAIYVPLPTGVRKEWVIKVAEAGKHVMCEKPCAINAVDLSEMIAACEKNGVQFMDGIMYLHSKRFAAMKETLNDGQSVGDIRRICGNFSFNGPEEFQAGNIRTASNLEPQGCLGDLGWYQIRFALWAMNYEMPTKVIGRMISEHKRDDSPNPVPMEFSLDLFFANNVTANFYSSFITEHQQSCTVAGTQGYMRIDDFVLPFFGNGLHYDVFNSNFVVDRCDFTMERHTSSHSVHEYGNNHANAQETLLFQDFSQLVIDKQLDPSWPEASLKTQKIMDAALESALNGSVEIEL